MGTGSWLKPIFDRIMREVTFSCCSLYLKGILAAVTANDSLAHKVKMHTHAPHARTGAGTLAHALTHTHSHPGLCQVNRVISEGQDMERWKVTPPDTDSAPSSLLCIDKRLRQRAGRHAADKSSALPVSPKHALQSRVNVRPKSHPVPDIVKQMSASVRADTHFLLLFHWKPHRRNKILLICCWGKHKLLKSENILGPVTGANKHMSTRGTVTFSSMQHDLAKLQIKRPQEE